jgi:hypothetical protein
MDATTQKKEVTVLTDELRASLKPELDSLEAKAKTAGFEDGVKKERERLKAIDALALPGHETLIEQMKADGTSAADAAGKIVAAEKEKRSKALSNLRADGPNPAPAAIIDPTKNESGKDAKKPANAQEAQAIAQKLAKEAKEFVATEEKAGRTVTMAEAIKHVYEKAGVPTR